MLRENRKLFFAIRKQTLSLCLFWTLILFLPVAARSEVVCQLKNYQPGNIFLLGEPVKLGLKITGLPEKERAIVCYSVRDFWGNEVLKREKELKNIGLIELPIFEDPKIPGYFTVLIEIRRNDVILTKAVGSVCIIEPSPPEDKSFAWGL